MAEDDSYAPKADLIRLDPSLHLDPSPGNYPVTGLPIGQEEQTSATSFANLQQYLSQAQPSQTTSDVPVSSDLAKGRARFAQELQDPKVRNLMMSSMEAEVGNQQAPAWQAYAESVMNRANASNRSLVNTIIDPYNPRTQTGYYPPSTMNQLGASMSKEQIARYNPVIDSVLNGSNLSNLATGNESGHLHSMPVTYDPQSGERFVDEAKYADWRQNQLKALASSTQSAQAPPIQQLMGSVGSASPQLIDLSRYLQH